MNILYYLCEEAVKETCTKEIFFYVIIPLVSAFIGGLITFLGVKMTITFEKNSRLDTYKLQCRPYIAFWRPKALPINPNDISNVNLSKIPTLNARSLTEMDIDMSYYFTIKSSTFVNLDVGHCRIFGIKINDKDFLFEEDREYLVYKGNPFIIQANEYVLYYKGEIKNINLIVSDISGYRYDIKLYFNEEKVSKRFGTPKNNQVKSVREIEITAMGSPKEVKGVQYGVK